MVGGRYVGQYCPLLSTEINVTTNDILQTSCYQTGENRFLDFSGKYTITNIKQSVVLSHFVGIFQSFC